MLSHSDLIELTGRCGQFRFHYTGQEVLHGCLWCDATFPQTDEGFKALRAHEFEHGTATTLNALELHGKTLRIMVVQGVSEGQFPHGFVDVYGVDDAAGVVYHLSDKYLSTYGDTKDTKWKWKLPTKGAHGPNGTPNVLALLSNGSETTAAK